jgi:hypothetical protein
MTSSSKNLPERLAAQQTESVSALDSAGAVGQVNEAATQATGDAGVHTASLTELLDSGTASAEASPSVRDAAFDDEVYAPERPRRIITSVNIAE